MNSQLSRRNLAKGAAWVAPALTVASAAPALAVSCSPKTVTTNSAATWTSAQMGCTSDNGDPEYHTVQYTLTNQGPDELPAGIELDIQVTIAVLQGEAAQVQVTQASRNVTATAQSTSTNDDDAGTTTLVATVKVVTSSPVAVGDEATVTLLATYGVFTAEGDVAAEELVTADSPQTITNAADCLTTVATVTITGASNGTSYTSPASCSDPNP